MASHTSISEERTQWKQILQFSFQFGYPDNSKYSSDKRTVDFRKTKTYSSVRLGIRTNRWNVRFKSRTDEHSFFANSVCPVVGVAIFLHASRVFLALRTVWIVNNMFQSGVAMKKFKDWIQFECRHFISIEISWINFHWIWNLNFFDQMLYVEFYLP